MALGTGAAAALGVGLADVVAEADGVGGFTDTAGTPYADATRESLLGASSHPTSEATDAVAAARPSARRVRVVLQNGHDKSVTRTWRRHEAQGSKPMRRAYASS